MELDLLHKIKFGFYIIDNIHDDFVVSSIKDLKNLVL